MWANSVIKKTAKVKNQPMGESSPNLVTLPSEHTQFSHESSIANSSKSSLARYVIKMN
jgi:hypothetical protein